MTGTFGQRFAIREYYLARERPEAPKSFIDSTEAFPRFPREMIDEVFDQHRNVFSSFPRGRNLNRKDVSR